MVASRSSAGNSSSFQMVVRMSRKVLKAAGPSALNSSAGMSHLPGALPQLIWFIAVRTSSSLGVRSRSSWIGWSGISCSDV